MTSIDANRVQQALALFEADKLLPALRLFRQVTDDSLLQTPKIQEAMRLGQIMEAAVTELSADPQESWHKQKEVHGTRDFLVYYKYEDSKLKCRIDCVIEESLYIPFLATMNETDLYATWIPKWSFPKVGVAKSHMLEKSSRVNQVFQLMLDMPLPLRPREIVMHGFAHEDIDENGISGAKVIGLQEYETDAGQAVRMELDGGFLFRKCPPDHACLRKSKSQYPESERLVLLSFIMSANPKVSYMPESLINFTTRTVLGTVWNGILRVAEQVRANDRPELNQRIEEKREEVYDWVEERVNTMLNSEKVESASSS